MTSHTKRWIRIRGVVDGWITIDMDAIESLQFFSPNCFALRMLSGSLILLTKKEGNRLLQRVLPKGIRP